MAPDSRFRPYRRAVFGVFVVFSTLYVFLVGRGITVSLMHQGRLPLGAPANECRRDADSCAQGILALRAELDAEACELERTGTQAERLWDDWSQKWQRDLSTLR